MSVSNNDRRTVVAASGGQTALTADYILYATNEVTVTRTRAGIDTVLVLTTNYTVSGLSTPAGFTVTLVSGATAGDTYTIEGTRPERSTAAFVNRGDFASSEVNLLYDYAAVERQEIRRDVDDLMTAIGDLDAGDTIITGTLTQTYLPLASDSDGTLADSVVSQSGTLVNIAGTARISSAEPVITFDETDGGANQRYWNLHAQAALFALRIYSDDLLTTNPVMTVSRSGATVGTVTLYGTIALANDLAVTEGGTGLSAGTSGGIPYFSAAATMASSAALGATQLVMGGGAGAAPNTSAFLYFDGVTLHARQETAGLPEKGFRATLSGNQTLASGLRIEKSRGTLAAPTEIAQYNAIGSVDMAPYVNGSYQYMGGLRSTTENVPAGNFVPTQMTIWTSDGSTGTYPGLIVTAARHLGGGDAHTNSGGLGFPTYTTVEDWIDIRVDGAVLPPKLRLSYADNAVFFPALNLVRRRGTHAAPTSVVNTLILGGTDVWGYQNAGERLCAREYFTVNGTPSGNFVPASWTLQLGTDAAVPTDAVVVSAAKNMTVTGTIGASNFSGSSSGTNTGDQTGISSLSGTMAQFDTACSDGNFSYQSQAASFTTLAASGITTLSGVVNATSDVQVFQTSGDNILLRYSATVPAIVWRSAAAADITEINEAGIGLKTNAQIWGVYTSDSVALIAATQVTSTTGTVAITGSLTVSTTLGVTGAATVTGNFAVDTGVLQVDSVNNFVSLDSTGTSRSPEQILEIFDTNNTNDLPPMQIRQLGTGDSSIRMRVAALSWTIGLDNSDSDAFKIVASTVLSGATAVIQCMTGGEIGISQASPNANAVMDFGGIRPIILPRLTTAQKAAVTQVAGMMVYDTTLGKACIRGAAAWETITSV